MQGSGDTMLLFTPVEQQTTVLKFGRKRKNKEFKDCSKPWSEKVDLSGISCSMIFFVVDYYQTHNILILTFKFIHIVSAL